MTATFRRATAIVMTCAMGTAASCSLATSINRNSDAIGKSTAAISDNTDTIQQSTKATGNLVPALQDVGKLQEPMKAVAALDPTMKSVAALSDPMTRVAGLEPAMRGLGELREPMINLVAIKPSLDAAAALGGPLGRVADMRTSLESVAELRGSLTQVASLDTQLKAVADLRPAMEQLGGLKQPLERVGALGEPLQQLGPVLALLEHPILLILAILLGFAAWFAVTFFAVKLAILSAARKTATAVLFVCAFALASAAGVTPAFAQDAARPLDTPHAGDCALTFRIPPTTPADTLRIALDSEDARVLFKVAQVQPFVAALSDPLREGSKVIVTIGSQPAFTVTVEPSLVDPDHEPNSCTDKPPAASEYDGRETFEANAFYGLAIDNFAPAETSGHPEEGFGYRNTPQGTIKTRWTAGVQAQYRVIGRQDSVRQFWLSTQILHGLRTADVDCTKTPDLAVCKATATEAQKFFAVLEHASTMEAHIEGRFELLRLQVSELTPVKVFASTRFGFVGLAGAPKVFSSDAYVGGGLMAPKGVFRGSFAQVAWGKSRQFQTDPNANRMKIYGTLIFDVAPGLVEQARNIFSQSLGSTRFFASIVVDRNPGGRAPDSVQSYFGIDFDVRRLVGGF